MRMNIRRKFAGACLQGHTLLALTLASLVSAAEPSAYQPSTSVTGILRATGNDQMSELLQRWQMGFQKFHPEVRFENTLKGSAAAMYGLDLRTADFALMGRPVFPYERYGTYERSWVFPLEIEVATGSATALRKSPAYAIFIHRDNPITRLTLADRKSVV